jgi:hypothetical protein
MPEGKLLQMDVSAIPAAKESFWWYRRYHEKSGYVPLEKIGLDINYKKHYNHGIEVRFFDWFPEERLLELLEILVYAANHALEKGSIFNCAASESWNDTVMGVFEEGAQYRLTSSALASYEKLFQCELVGKSLTIHDMFLIIRKHLRKLYKHGWLAGFYLTCDDERGGEYDGGGGRAFSFLPQKRSTYT